MKKKYTIGLLLLFKIIFLFSLLSCQHEDLDVYIESENFSNATDFVKNNYELSLFSSAIEYAGLSDTLRQSGPFTVFAPNNEAFNGIGIFRKSDFEKMDKDSLKKILAYHILPKRFYLKNVPVNTIDNKHKNLLGKDLFLGNRNESDYFINGASSPTLKREIELANGVLHVLDKVLKYNNSVQDILSSNPKFSYFVTFLKQMGYWEKLANTQSVTVFAPTNEAFEREQINLEQIKIWNPSDFHKRFWNVYIVNNHFFLSDLKVYGPLVGSGYFGGPFYKSIISEDEYYYFGISKENPIRPFIIDIRGYQDTPNRISAFSSYHETDYKADNGIVHSLNLLLVLPNEGLIH